MIADELGKRGVHFVVAEQNREMVDQLRKRDIAAVAGNAAEPSVLVQAHIANAALLVIATPDTFHVRAMVETARILNPGIDILVRTHSEDDAELLRSEGVGKIFLGEQELATNMTAHIFQALDKAAH
jgi:CPA2 family monovalent cation:H+ antiporter-2